MPEWDEGTELTSAHRDPELTPQGWTFTVTPGRYRVSTTWTAHSNRPTNAPYTILDGNTEVATVAVNQRQAPNDLNDAGSAWENLGSQHNILGTTLVVELSDAGNGYAIADAVRIERLGRCRHRTRD